MISIIILATAAAAAPPVDLLVETPYHNPSTAPYAYALPDVPGADNPDVTQDNLAETLCRPGHVSGNKTWIAYQRPPDSYTNAIKRRLMVELHLPGTIADYELDHDKSIEDSGSPTSLLNLWMQPYKLAFLDPEDGEVKDVGARVKDRVETKLHGKICDYTITILEARTALKTDWIAAYLKYVGPLPAGNPAYLPVVKQGEPTPGKEENAPTNDEAAHDDGSRAATPHNQGN